jgi:hypothetical protein
VSTTSPTLAEGGRLAIALARAYQNDDRAGQVALLRQIAKQQQTANVLLAMTSMLVNLVGLAAAELDATDDDVWQTLIVLHGEVQQ